MKVLIDRHKGGIIIIDDDVYVIDTANITRDDAEAILEKDFSVVEIKGRRFRDAYVEVSQ